MPGKPVRYRYCSNVLILCKPLQKLTKGKMTNLFIFIFKSYIPVPVLKLHKILRYFFLPAGKGSAILGLNKNLYKNEEIQQKRKISINPGGASITFLDWIQLAPQSIVPSFQTETNILFCWYLLCACWWCCLSSKTYIIYIYENQGEIQPYSTFPCPQNQSTIYSVMQCCVS